MAEITKVQMTASEFLELPETMTPTQLIDGEVIMSPSPEILHQDLVAQGYEFLKALVPNGKVRFSPLDVWLDEVDVVQPDIFWIAEGGACKPSKNRKHFIGAPALILEVLSRGTEKLDRGKKFDLYQKHGVREYWIVHPQEQYVEVYSRVDEKLARTGVFGADETFHSPLLDKDVELKTLFAD